MKRSIPAKMIDAHHHLWNLDACAYPWLMEKGKKRFFGDPTQIQKNYLVADYKRDFSPLPIVNSVHVQVGVSPDDAVKETEWLQGRYDSEGYPGAIVAYADLTHADLQQTLMSHLNFENLRGFRQIIGRNSNEDARNNSNQLLESTLFRSGLEELAHQNLTFDLQLTPPLMVEASKVFKSVKGLPVAICHAGSLQDFSETGVRQWKGGLRGFAERENTICKISGFGMFTPRWSREAIKDYVLDAIDIFSPQRIAFGSNFPVDKLHVDYNSLFEAYLSITESFSDDERHQMFYGTAKAFYNI